VTDIYSLSGKRVFVAGHRGMVGAALIRRLARENCDVITIDRSGLDLRDQAATRKFLGETKPDAVVIAAAKVGGILANDTLPAEFLHDNLVLEANLIEGAFRASVEKLLFLGSSCIYPKVAPQPMSEDALLTGPLEPTNEWYAIAKIAGLKLCEAYRKQYGVDYISAMPTNLYGPGDNFDLNTSHVIPALIRKAHDAKIAHAESMSIWGTGAPYREFLHVDDCADALIFLMRRYSGAQHVNVGSGEEVTIKELARLVMAAVGYDGMLAFDRSKPDGTPRKLMNSERLASMGWRPSIALKDGLAETYKWFVSNAHEART